jgi:hypothetical protein
MKLRCNIAPLPHDSEDYKLVERYLLNTHAPTHKVWPYVFAVFILLILGSSGKHSDMLFWGPPANILICFSFEGLVTGTRGSFFT